MERFNFENNKRFNVKFGKLLEVPVEITEDIYEGTLTVIPKAHEQQILETKDKRMMNNITVQKIPYFETSNDTGKTIYIGSEV